MYTRVPLAERHTECAGYFVCPETRMIFKQKEIDRRGNHATVSAPVQPAPGKRRTFGNAKHATDKSYVNALGTKPRPEKGRERGTIGCTAPGSAGAPAARTAHGTSPAGTYNTGMQESISWTERLVEARAARKSASARAAKPHSTYRIQLERDSMTFRAAADVAPYLEQLGISHVYTSPDRKAKAGSPHGYAIVDYDALNPELGSERRLSRRLVAALRQMRAWGGCTTSCRTTWRQARAGREPLVVDRRAGERAGFALCNLFRHRLGPGQRGTQEPAALATLGTTVRRGAGVGRAARRISRRRL